MESWNQKLFLHALLVLDESQEVTIRARPLPLASKKMTVDYYSLTFGFLLALAELLTVIDLV